MINKFRDISPKWKQLLNQRLIALFTYRTNWQVRSCCSRNPKRACAINSIWNDSLFYQLDLQILYFNTFIIFFYMFRALLCSSSGGQIVLVQHLVSSLSLGDCSVHRIRKSSHHSHYVTVQTTGYVSPLVPCGLNSHLKRVTIPDAALIQFVLLKMSTMVLGTCRGV